MKILEDGSILLEADKDNIKFILKQFKGYRVTQMEQRAKYLNQALEREMEILKALKELGFGKETIYATRFRKWEPRANPDWKPGMPDWEKVKSVWVNEPVILTEYKYQRELANVKKRIKTRERMLDNTGVETIRKLQEYYKLRYEN